MAPSRRSANGSRCTVGDLGRPGALRLPAQLGGEAGRYAPSLVAGQAGECPVQGAMQGDDRRLVAWREAVAADPPARYRGERYWARPVPGFGDDDPGILVVGLAPAANGANRTGRMFTGDGSADFLVAALHRAGLANQPESLARDDGLDLTGCRMTAVVRCAPPANRPTVDECDACVPFLHREIDLCGHAGAIVCLDQLAWDAVIRLFGPPRPKPRFAHGAEIVVDGRTLLASHHPSQQNAFTGRLTPAMLDAVLGRARVLARR